MLIERNTPTAKKKVKIKLLVGVSEYGTIPLKLQKKTKLNKVAILVKRPPLSVGRRPKFSKKIGAIISLTISSPSVSKIESSSSTALPKKVANTNKLPKFSVNEYPELSIEAKIVELSVTKKTSFEFPVKDNNLKSALGKVKINKNN